MKTVLVVDDDKDLCASVRRLLEEALYEVVCAYDVQQAKHSMLAKNRRFDVALLDMRMADDKEAGLKLLRWIRDEGVAITPIVLTGYGEIQNAVTAMQAGAFSYVEKGREQQAELIRLTVDKAFEEVSVVRSAVQVTAKVRQILRDLQSVEADLRRITDEAQESGPTGSIK